MNSIVQYIIDKISRHQFEGQHQRGHNIKDNIKGVRPLCLVRQPETELLAGLVEFTVECGFFVGDDHSCLPFGLTYRHLSADKLIASTIAFSI